jgi:predicted alpha-1,6-mannanase (GH76 family)
VTAAAASKNTWKIAALLALVPVAGCSPSGSAAAGVAQGGTAVVAVAGQAGGGASSGAAGAAGSGGGFADIGGTSGSGGVRPVREPATAHNLDSGDDFIAASNSALFGLADMFDNARGQFSSGPRWSWASGVEASINAYQRSNGLLFPNLFVATFDLNRAGNFLDDLGYDDEGWWGNAWVHAYDATGDARYLAMAKLVFDDMATAWDPSTCNGGVWWNRQNHYKNAITSELFFLLAASLHRRAPGDTEYWTWADKAWRWFDASGLVNASGLVQDGLSGDCKGNGQTAWTYNQGVVLGGLVEMYEATSDAQYLNSAKKLADASTTKMVSGSGILVESCEAKGCSNDASNFKGIYQRYLARLAALTQSPEYAAFLLKNARSVWSRARHDGAFGLAWSGPFDMADAPRQGSALHALQAVTPAFSQSSRFVRAAGGKSFNHELGFAAAPGGWGCDARICPTSGVMQGGPFLASLPEGAHEARFRVSMNDPPPPGALIVLEVYDSRSQQVVANRELTGASFVAQGVAQTFGVPFVQTAVLGPLELRVRWLALAGAPEVVVSDVAIDGEDSFAAASLEHECGRFDAHEQLVSDRHHEPAACVLGRARGVSLEAVAERVSFELGVDEFWDADSAIAQLSVAETGGAVVAMREVKLGEFGDGLLHAFSLDFSAALGKRYDFVVQRLAPAQAPRLTLRAVYVRRAATEQSLALAFDVRGVGTAAGDADVDGLGSAFASESLAKLAWPITTFELGPLSQPGPNVLASNGQTLDLGAAPARALHVLLFAVGGRQADNTFSVAYSQGASQTFTRSASDWATPLLEADEHLALSAPFRWSKSGKQYGSFHVTELTLPLDPARAATTLTLPKNPKLEILALTVSR